MFVVMCMEPQGGMAVIENWQVEVYPVRRWSWETSPGDYLVYRFIAGEDGFPDDDRGEWHVGRVEEVLPPVVLVPTAPDVTIGLDYLSRHVEPHLQKVGREIFNRAGVESVDPSVTESVADAIGGLSA